MRDEWALSARRQRVAADCKAVAHLARCVSAGHERFAELLAAGEVDELLDQVARCAAEQLKALTTIMDAMYTAIN